MRRRRFIQTIASLPIIGVPLFGQNEGAQRRPSAAPSPVGQVPPEGQSAPVVKTVFTEAVGAIPEQHFFSKTQFQTLYRLGEIFLPPMNGKPRAVEAAAPQFLDFYVGVFGSARKEFYQNGLDDLNAQAKTKFAKAFFELNNKDADSILKPMFKPRGPLQGSLEFGPFINRVYQDLWTATVNSPAMAASARAAGQRVGAPLYWQHVDPTILLHRDATSSKRS